MKKLNAIIRLLLGVMMLTFGFNKFLDFIATPSMKEPANEFMLALINSGYLMTIIAIVEIVTGALLLMNKFKTLALVMLFPVLLNAFLFHFFLDIAGIGGASIGITMNIYLFFANKNSYLSILKV